MLPVLDAGSINSMNADKADASEAVIVRLKLSDAEFGEWSEREATYTLEDQLIDVFAGGAALGEFDGHEFGGGFATLYMYGRSADRIAEAVLPVLAQGQHRAGSTLVKRFGPPGAPEQTIALSEGSAYSACSRQRRVSE